MKTLKIKNIVSVLCLVFFLILAAGSASNDNTTQQVEKSTSGEATSTAANAEAVAFKLTAPELYKDYKANEVSADKKYKDKILEVTGEVQDIKKDITNTMYVTLKGDQYIGSVQCYFSDKYENELTNLKSGQTITVKGKCDGLMMNVLLKGCVLSTTDK